MGHWGPKVLRAFRSVPGVSVTVVCDCDPQRLKRVETGAAAAVGEASAIIAGEALDCIAVCTPLASHYELAREALEAGKHVFVEKPLAATSDQCCELIHLARRQRKILFVGHIFLYNEGIRLARSLIERGALGRLIAIEARRINLGPVREDADAFWDLVSHDLSILGFWLRRQPSHVSAHGIISPGGRVPDLVSGVFEFDRGLIATVHATWLRPPKIREIAVIGEHKVLVWNDCDLDQPVRIYSRNQEPHSPPGEQNAPEIPPVVRSEPLLRECEHFIACVRSGEQPLSDGIDGLHVVCALEAAERSMNRGGRRLPVPRIPEFS